MIKRNVSAKWVCTLRIFDGGMRRKRGNSAVGKAGGRASGWLDTAISSVLKMLILCGLIVSMRIPSRTCTVAIAHRL